jgi:hypothetical protein
MLEMNHDLTTLDCSRAHILIFLWLWVVTGSVLLSSVLAKWRLCDAADNGMGDAGAQAFASALKTNHTLTTLDLSSAFPSCYELLFGHRQRAFGLKRLTGGAADNDFGAAGAEELAKSLHTNRTLTTLNVKGARRDHPCLRCRHIQRASGAQ